VEAVTPMNASTIIVADPHWKNECDAVVGNLSAAVRTNGSGRISFHIPAADMVSWGFDEIKGRWVYVDTAFGPVAGFVEDDPADLGDGILELSCVDMTGLLDIAITPVTYKELSKSPGGMIKAVVRGSGLDTPTLIGATEIDEHGRPVTLEYRGDAVGRTVQTLARNAYGYLWVEIDDDRVLTLHYRTTPHDARNTILLIECREILDGSIRPSLSDVVNDVTGVGNNKDWERAKVVRVSDQASIKKYDQRRRAAFTYQDVTRAAGVEPLAQADLKRHAFATGPVNFEIWDEHPICAELELAQLVTVWSSTNNKTFDCTITGLAHDTNQHTITVAGSVTEQA
jgi:hypothetical protein